MERLFRDAVHMLEWLDRVKSLQKRGLSHHAAVIVVDAAMLGIGCLEGEVRKRIQKELDGKTVDSR